MPPVKKDLFLSVSFWAELLSILDRKIQKIHEGEGYGQISFKMVMQNRKVVRVEFNEDVTVKSLQEMANQHLDTESNDA